MSNENEPSCSNIIAIVLMSLNEFYVRTVFKYAPPFRSHATPFRCYEESSREDCRFKKLERFENHDQTRFGKPK